MLTATNIEQHRIQNIEHKTQQYNLLILAHGIEVRQYGGLHEAIDGGREACVDRVLLILLVPSHWHRQLVKCGQLLRGGA